MREEGREEKREGGRGEGGRKARRRRREKANLGSKFKAMTLSNQVLTSLLCSFLIIRISFSISMLD